MTLATQPATRSGGNGRDAPWVGNLGRGVDVPSVSHDTALTPAWATLIAAATRLPGEEPSYSDASAPTASPSSFMATLKELVGMRLPEAKWAVPGVLSQGVTLLGGKPKTGKSWLALAWSIAVASGGCALGNIRVQRGDVLYLALEDNWRRLQSRARKLLKDDPIPDGLELATRWKRLNEGGLVMLSGWLEQHPQARLVVIDTLAKVRPRRNSTGPSYGTDYDELQPLRELAERFGVAILVIHHLRKMNADDPIDELNGTTGLTGAADGILILRRERGKADAALHVTGKDVENEAKLALGWDAATAQWALLGEAAEVQMSDQRRAIRNVIAQAGRPLGPKEIADALDQPSVNIRSLLSKMAGKGEVLNHDGTYALPSI